MMPDEMNRYYDVRAAEYEQIYYRDNPVRRRELAEESVRLIELSRGREILELACGTGYWTERMAQSAESVTAVDLSPAMLLEARRKKYPSPVRFVRADMYHAPFESSAFDLVALGFWFSHHPRQDYEQLFDLISLPLRAGGKVWMIDNNPAAEGTSEPTLRRDRYGNTYKTRVVNDGRKYEILKNYFNRNELQDLPGRRFAVEQLTYGDYYWSAILNPIKE